MARPGQPKISKWDEPKKPQQKKNILPLHVANCPSCRFNCYSDKANTAGTRLKFVCTCGCDWDMPIAKARKPK